MVTEGLTRGRSKPLISGQVVDPQGLPACVPQVQFGDGEIVDLVGKGLERGDAKGLLDLGEDRAEMGDSDDVAPRMGVEQALDGTVHTGGDLVPAFAAGGADIAGLIPESAQVILIGDGIESLQFPVTEVNFAQVTVMGQPGAVGGYGVGSRAGADQVRRYDERLLGQMR